MKKATVASVLTIAVLIPLTLYLGTLLPGRMYYITGTLVIVEVLIPFFLAFESRKPQARELVIIAVLCALAVASRVVFAWAPFIKPTLAIIMIAGIAFGPETGFLVGAVSAFASNFAFGQGPWTPWQMMAYGIGGFLAGLAGKKKWISRQALAMGFFGFFLTVLLVGPLLDTCTIFTTMTTVSLESALLVYGSGIPVNLIHGVCVFLVMLAFSRPLLEKLERVQKKYGLLGDNPSQN